MIITLPEEINKNRFYLTGNFHFTCRCQFVVRAVAGPLVGQIHHEVADTAFVQLRQLIEDSERWLMASGAGPNFPIREVLEGFRFIRPAPIPFFSGLSLTPGMRQSKRHPSIDTILRPKYCGYLDPRLALTPKISRKPDLFLPEASRFLPHLACKHSRVG